jgi:hypothetical protein
MQDARQTSTPNDIIRTIHHDLATQVQRIEDPLIAYQESWWYEDQARMLQGCIDTLRAMRRPVPHNLSRAARRDSLVAKAFRAAGNELTITRRAVSGAAITVLLVLGLALPAHAGPRMHLPPGLLPKATVHAPRPPRPVVVHVPKPHVPRPKGGHR